MSSAICPQCGAALPPDAPQGLCPQCLLRNALPESTPAEPSTDSAAAMTGGTAAKGRLRYFGDYELIEEIARGGMGVVYRAKQVSLNRTVAVKMILAGQLAGAAEVKRFRIEAEAAANLQHPNIVAIHEIGEQAGQHYFSMDFIAGENLADYVRSHALSAAEIAALTKTLADAVHYAHQRGTLHRDLKPHNVLIDSQGRPHITDFGLAKKWNANEAAPDSDLTHTGAVMGSPSYMAPEQAAGRLGEIGPATDVYSLGAILYYLLTGEPPHRAATPLDTLRLVVTEDPVAPRKLRGATPPDLETICLKCLEKRPERRYATARQLAEELERFIHHEPILARRASVLRKLWSWTARRPWLIAVVASVLLAGALGVAFDLRERYRFERRQALLLQARHMAETAPTEEARRDAHYAEAMALLREAVNLRVDGDITRVALEVLARHGRPWRQVFHDHGRGTDVMLTAATSTEGRYVAAAFRDGVVELFDAATSRSVFKTTRLDCSQPRLACGPEGAWIALADAAHVPGKVWLWRRAENAIPITIDAHAGAVNALGFSPDGRWLAIGGQAATETGRQPEVRLWDLGAGRIGQTIKCFAAQWPIIERYHAQKRMPELKNEILRVEFSSDSRLLYVRSDLRAAEVLRVGESSEPVVEAEALRVSPARTNSLGWLELVARDNASAMHQLWQERGRWSSYLASGAVLAPSRAERAWRIEWNKERAGQRDLMSPDHRFLSAEFLASDLRARPAAGVPMSGKAFALTSDGAWVVHDGSRAAFNFWRVSDVEAEWKRLGLWSAIREPPSEQLVFMLELRSLGVAVLCFAIAIVATTCGYRMAMLRARGRTPSRILTTCTLGVGAISLFFGLSLVVRFASLAVWSRLDVNTITIQAMAMAAAAAVWGLAAVVRAAQEYHSGLIGFGATRYRSSLLTWIGALVGGLLFVRGLFPDALPDKRRQLMLPNFTPVEINVSTAWWTLAAAAALGLIAAVVGARLARRGKAARRWALAGFAVVIVGWLFAVGSRVGGENMPAVLFGVPLGALLAVVLFPSVHETLDREQEERAAHRLDRREQKRATTAQSSAAA